MLLMLTGAYLTNDIVKFITGMDFTLMSFQFLNAKEISILKPIIDYLHYKQKDESLNEIGIESSSTLINDLSLILAAILLFFIVLAIRLIKFLVCERKKIKKNIAKWCWKWLRTRVSNLIQFFGIPIYVRLFLESYQFILLSCASEIEMFNTNPKSKMVSLDIALFVLILALVVIFLISGYILWSNPKNPKTHLSELFSGLKPFSRRYYILPWLTLNTTLWSIWILIFINGHIIPKIIWIIFFKVLLISYLTIYRPYEYLKDNIVTIINESLFTLLLSYQIHYNKESKWTRSI